MLARRATFSALRSARLSFGPPTSLRRRRASAAVIGAGATGPRLRAASLRFGVGLPLGAMVPPTAALWPASASEPAESAPSSESELSFLRPSSLTLVRLLARRCCPACTCAIGAIVCRHAGSDSPRLLRRQPDGRRGCPCDRGRLAPRAPRR